MGSGNSFVGLMSGVALSRSLGPIFGPKELLDAETLMLESARDMVRSDANTREPMNSESMDMGLLGAMTMQKLAARMVAESDKNCSSLDTLVRRA